MSPLKRADVGIVGRLWQGHRLASVSSPWGIFWRGLLLLLPWVGLLLLCLLGVLVFHLWTEGRVRSCQALVEVTATLEASSGTQPLILQIYHPKGLLLDPQATPSFVFLRLYRASSTPLPPGQAPSPTVVATATPASTPMPTPTPPIYYVSFRSVPGLNIVDSKGQPLPDRLVITPAPQPGVPVVAYLVPADLSPGRQITLDMSMVQEGEPSLGANLPLKLQVESSWLLIWRRLAVLLTSTPAVLTAILGALLSLIVQQWRYLESTTQERRLREEEALKEVRQLEQMLQENLSEGARKYVELCQRPETEWQKGRVKQALEEIWRMNTPSELQVVVDIVEASDRRLLGIIEKQGLDACAQALTWALDNLEETWREKIGEVVNDLTRKFLSPDRPGVASKKIGEVVNDLARKGVFSLVLGSRIEEMLKARVWSQYPSLTFWRKEPYYEGKADVRAGMEFLGLERSPFGSSRAEEDSLLESTWIQPSWMGRFKQTPAPAGIIGPAGVGKTACALLSCTPCVGGSGIFSVYHQISAQVTDSSLLQGLAHSCGRVLLAYMAMFPQTFLRLDTVEQLAIVRLWLSEMGTVQALRLQLYEAGLPRKGEGARVLELIQDLVEETSQGVICPAIEELPRIIAQALPYGYTRLAVWLDGQEPPTDPGYLNALCDLVNRLCRVGIQVYLFLPKAAPCHGALVGNISLPLPLEPVRWQEKDLQALLKKRLGVTGEESVAAWCQPDVRDVDVDVDGWLVHAAEGCPGRMITLGNALLSRIGAQRGLLSHEDLEEILGAYPHALAGE